MSVGIPVEVNLAALAAPRAALAAPLAALSASLLRLFGLLSRILLTMDGRRSWDVEGSELFGLE